MRTLNYLIVVSIATAGIGLFGYNFSVHLMQMESWQGILCGVALGVPALFGSLLLIKP